MKKLVREAKGERGSRSNADELLDELADGIICLDLLAMAEHLPEMPMNEVYKALPNADLNAYGVWLDVAVGRITNHHFEQNIEPAYNASQGLPSTRTPAALHQDYLMASIIGAAGIINTIARQIGIFDMRQAVSKKFNRTSAKNSLPVFLNWDEVLTTSEVLPRV